MEMTRSVRPTRLIDDARKSRSGSATASRLRPAPADRSTRDSVSDFPRDAGSTNPAAAHDAELVRRFNAGDTGAFDEIVRRHRDKMFAVALATLRNHADAEEIAQDTFIRAYRGLARFRGESSLSTWLHRIASNLACNRYWYFFRRHRQDSRSFDCTLGDDGETTLADLLASESPDPAREVANREFSAQVAACMAKLSERQREILTLRNLLDHSYEEIAEILGISLGTVKSRIARARQSLRALLAESYENVESDEISPSFSWFESTRPSGQLVSVSG